MDDLPSYLSRVAGPAAEATGVVIISPPASWAPRPAALGDECAFFTRRQRLPALPRADARTGDRRLEDVLMFSLSEGTVRLGNFRKEGMRRGRWLEGLVFGARRGEGGSEGGAEGGAKGGAEGGAGGGAEGVVEGFGGAEGCDEEKLAGDGDAGLAAARNVVREGNEAALEGGGGSVGGAVGDADEGAGEMAGGGVALSAVGAAVACEEEAQSAKGSEGGVLAVLPEALCTAAVSPVVNGKRDVSNPVAETALSVEDREELPVPPSSISADDSDETRLGREQRSAVNAAPLGCDDGLEVLRGDRMGDTDASSGATSVEVAPETIVSAERQTASGGVTDPLGEEVVAVNVALADVSAPVAVDASFAGLAPAVAVSVAVVSPFFVPVASSADIDVVACKAATNPDVECRAVHQVLPESGAGSSGVEPVSAPLVPGDIDSIVMAEIDERAREAGFPVMEERSKQPDIEILEASGPISAARAKKVFGDSESDDSFDVDGADLDSDVDSEAIRKTVKLEAKDTNASLEIVGEPGRRFSMRASRVASKPIVEDSSDSDGDLMEFDRPGLEPDFGPEWDKSGSTVARPGLSAAMAGMPENEAVSSEERPYIRPTIEEYEEGFWRTLARGVNGKPVDLSYGVDVEAEGAFDSTKWSYAEKAWSADSDVPLVNLLPKGLSLAQEGEAERARSKMTLPERNPNRSGLSAVDANDCLPPSPLPRWHPGNINFAGVLRHLPRMPGLNTSMFYVGQLFTRFCWHVEDGFLNSFSYLHPGSAEKIWYVIPPEYADAFETYAAQEVFAPCLQQGGKNGRALLGNKTTLFDPRDCAKRGIPVHRAVHKAGTFVYLAPRAYHGGFNTGYGVAEAVNFCQPSWFPVGRLASANLRANRQPMPIPLEFILFREAVDLVGRLENERNSSRAPKLGEREQLVSDARVVALELDRVIEYGELAIKDFSSTGIGCRIIENACFATPSVDDVARKSYPHGIPRKKLAKNPGLVTARHSAQLDSSFGRGAGMSCAVCMNAAYFYVAVCGSCTDGLGDARCPLHFSDGGPICAVPGHIPLIMRRHSPVLLYDLLQSCEQAAGITVDDATMLERYTGYVRTWKVDHIRGSTTSLLERLPIPENLRVPKTPASDSVKIRKRGRGRARSHPRKLDDVAAPPTTDNTEKRDAAGKSEPLLEPSMPGPSAGVTGSPSRGLASSHGGLESSLVNVAPTAGPVLPVSPRDIEKNCPSPALPTGSGRKSRPHGDGTKGETLPTSLHASLPTDVAEEQKLKRQSEKADKASSKATKMAAMAMEVAQAASKAAAQAAMAAGRFNAAGSGDCLESGKDSGNETMDNLRHRFSALSKEGKGKGSGKRGRTDGGGRRPKSKKRRKSSPEDSRH